MGRKLKDPVKPTTVALDFDNYYFLRVFMKENDISTLAKAMNTIIRDYALQYVVDYDEEGGVD